MDPTPDTSSSNSGSRPFILQPLPLAVQMLPLFGCIFIITGVGGFFLSLWDLITTGSSNFLLFGGASYALIFIGTLTIALYHFFKATIENQQINASWGKRG